MSAETGQFTAFTIRSVASTIMSRLMRCPSAYPREAAIPELVVAIAGNRACSKIRALAASQAFGSTRMGEPECRERNWTAVYFWVVEAITLTSSIHLLHF